MHTYSTNLENLEDFGDGMKKYCLISRYILLSPSAQKLHVTLLRTHSIVNVKAVSVQKKKKKKLSRPCSDVQKLLFHVDILNFPFI